MDKEIKKLNVYVKFFKLLTLVVVFTSILFGFSTANLNKYILNAMLFNLSYIIIVSFIIFHYQNKIENIKQYYKQ
jgi:hypothetical protein